MKSIKYFMLCAIACSCFAQEPVQNNTVELIPFSDKEICSSIQIENNSSLFESPGNCPIEILRRLGRLVAPHWPKDKNVANFATILFEKFAGSPNFIKYFKVEQLTDKQQETCKKLIANHESLLNNLINEYPVSTESIKIKTVLNPQVLSDGFKKIAEYQGVASGPMSAQDIDKIRNYTIPALSMIKDIYGVFSLSTNGAFGRGIIEINQDKDFNNYVCLNKLTIRKYIDEKPLIAIAQTHYIGNASQTMQSLNSVCDMSYIKQLVASAGIDLEKDILENYTTESIFYINLTPTGENLIPDMRWVALIPKPEKLVSILPNLKNLCLQTGIFITAINCPVENTSLVKLSHCMVPQYGIYTALIDKFLIITSTQEGAIEALKHLSKLPDNTIKDDIDKSNFYVRVKTSDLNVQLQQFLQSPMMANQGIPPISNLTFLNDIKIIEACTYMDKNTAKINIDIPFIELKEK